MISKWISLVAVALLAMAAGCETNDYDDYEPAPAPQVIQQPYPVGVPVPGPVQREVIREEVQVPGPERTEVIREQVPVLVPVEVPAQPQAQPQMREETTTTTERQRSNTVTPGEDEIDESPTRRTGESTRTTTQTRRTTGGYPPQ